jgi:ketosteroid isomerase-like protein
MANHSIGQKTSIERIDRPRAAKIACLRHSAKVSHPIQNGDLREENPMKQILITSFLIALSATLAAGQSVDAVTKTPEASADELILLRMEREWNEALQKRDVEWFEQNLAGDMTDISTSGVLQTKTEEIIGLKEDKTTYVSLELSGLKARVEGNVGIVTGINHIKARDEKGQTVEMRLAFTDTYIKRDGRWQVWASQHTRTK